MKIKKHKSGQIDSRNRTHITERKPHTKEIDLKLDRIGNIIREARLNQGLTQEELAELVDVTPAYIGHIERNQRSFSLQTLVKLVTELDIDMNYLFSESVPTSEEQIIIDFKQLIKGKPLQTQEAVLDIVRTALKYL
jgi:transcriptional regulator with XRE-family HTH domain